MLLLKNIDEFKTVKEFYPELLQGNSILVIYFELWLLLRNEGCPAKFRSEYLDINDYSDIKERARYLSQSWYSPIKEYLNYNSIDIADIWRTQNTAFFMEIVAANIVVERVIAKEKPSRIIVIGETNIPCADATRYNGQNDVFKEICIGIARSKGIEVHIIQREAKKKSTGYKKCFIKAALPHFLFISIIKPGLNLLKRKQSNELKWSVTKSLMDKPLIISLAYSYDAEILYQVHEILQKSNTYNTILISGNIDALNTLRSGLDDREVLYLPVRHFSRISYKTVKKVHAFCARAKNIWVQYRDEIDQRNGYYFPKKQIDDWIEIDILNTCIRIEVGEKIFNVLKPNIFMTDDMASSTQRILGRIARAAGIVTVSIPHGCIRDIEEYEFGTDLFFAWGPISKKQLIKKFCYDEKRIQETGSLVMEKISDNIKNAREGKDSNAVLSNVLILTGALTSEIFGKIDGDEYLAAWKQLKEYMHSHLEVKFIIKPHPYCDYHLWYTQFIKNSGLKNVVLIKDKSLESLIQNVKYVILFQIISTAALIAIMASKPVMFINNAVRNGAGDPSEDWNSQNGMININDSQLIQPALEKILIDSEYCNDVIERENSFLDNYLLYKDNLVGSRMYEALNSHKDGRQ